MTDIVLDLKGLDCPTMCAAYTPQEIIAGVRAYLTRHAVNGISGSDQALFVAAYAKYTAISQFGEAAFARGSTDHEAWSKDHTQLPDYMGSWFREHLKEQQ